LGEVFNYMKGQRAIMDPIGWGAAFFECEFKMLDFGCLREGLWKRANGQPRDCDLDLVVAGGWEDEEGRY